MPVQELIDFLGELGRDLDLAVLACREDHDARLGDLDSDAVSRLDALGPEPVFGKEDSGAVADLLKLLHFDRHSKNNVMTVPELKQGKWV